MKLPLYWIDAFTRNRFHGNPAAVVIMNEWPADAVTQSVAAENNLAETAFIVATGDKFAIRWFTPTVEIDLCGHATLASAYALRIAGLATNQAIHFTCASGPLTVSRDQERLALDFPARLAKAVPISAEIVEALGARPREVHQAQAMMAVFESEEEIRVLKPRLDLVKQQPGYGLVVTAPGRQSDFVSRFFAPQVGVPEDPVTGSTHCTLIPYWSRRLGRQTLYARQLSPRGGELWCEDRGDRVIIAGECALYLKGEIEI